MSRQCRKKTHQSSSQTTRRPGSPPAVNRHRDALAILKKELDRAVALHRSGNIEQAKVCYQSVLEIDPKHPDALHLMGMIASQQGDFDRAAMLIRQAIEQFPTSDIYFNNLGNALSRGNRAGEAIAAYQQALRINPSSLDAMNNLATNLKETGRVDEALALFRKALAIDPDAVEVYNNMGNALTELGLIDAAIDCFCRAIRLRPDYAVALNNLGSAYKLQERFKDAVDCYGMAVKVRPDYAEAFNNLGETLADMGRPDEAISFFIKAIELNPAVGLAAGNLFYALIRTCDWQQAGKISSALDEFLANSLAAGMCPPEDPFLNLIRHDNPEINYKVARAWSDAAMRRIALRAPGFDFSGYPSNKKMVIGYLSSNFHDHPMAHLMVNLLAMHDRKTFEVLCFSCGRDDGGQFRRRIVDNCDRFIDIRHLDHRAAARCIYENNVDILVDLMGHTKGNRLEIAAQRPAPIQVRYLGMAGTSGASFFDYLIADPTIVPRSHFRYYSEKIVHMPHCYQVNGIQQEASSESFKRKDLGLPEDGVVFCSFNQPYKIDAVIFESWMRIMQRVPGSVLWLQQTNPKVRLQLQSAAADNGIERDRLVFAERIEKQLHLRRLELADLALDTRMISGAATTSDALWAGVPVVTVKGRHFASRMSASIVSAIGLTELVTENLQAYESLVVDLALRPSERHAIRRRLRHARHSAPLFDTRRFTINLECAYRLMWQRFSSGRKPDAIEVCEF